MLAVLAFAFFLDSNLSQGSRSPAPPLIGHVRLIREEESDGLDPKATRIPVRVTRYDKLGRPIEKTDFARDERSRGRMTGRQLFAYDEKGQVIKIVSFDESNKLKNATTHTEKRNDRGQLIQENDGDSRTSYEYDGAGDCVRETWIDGSGKTRSKTTRTFDSSHHVLLEQTSDYGRKLDRETRYQLSAKGRATEREVSENGVLKYQTRWSYNDEGQLIASQAAVGEALPGGMNLYGSCGDCGIFPGHSNYRYDRMGRLTEQQWFQEDRLVRLDSYSYDERGNEVNAWVYQFKPDTTPKPGSGLRVNGREYEVGWINGLPSTTYSYDSQGNWTKAVTSRRIRWDANPQLNSVAFRLIDYY